jgi:hypothetical protein
MNLKLVHTTPYLTDFAYWAVRKADPFIQFYYRLRARIATLRPIRAFHLRVLHPCCTNVCNAKCIFCAYPKVDLEHGVMPMDMYRRVMLMWKERGGTNMDPTPEIGDPFADPLLRQRIEMAREAGMTVSLTTNGIGLKKHLDWIVQPGLTIYLSIPSLDSEVYHKIFGVDRGNEVREGLFKFLELNKQKGEPVRLQIRFRNSESPRVILRSEGFQKLRPYLSSQVQVNFTLWWDNWGGAIESLPESMPVRSHWKFNHPCTYLAGLGVQWNGNIRACCCRLLKSDDDALVVGHIDEGVEKAEQRTREIANGFYEGRRPEVCRDCRLYKPALDWH